MATGLLGKGVVDERSPWNTGAIGLLGTTASYHLMRECDTLLIVGSTMPYTEYYPAPGQARAVQIDVDGSRCGIRYDTEVNLTGDAAATLGALHGRLRERPGSTVSDPILLQRIVGNLIANAVKYTQHGGVLVASRATRKGLRLEIWDTGTGIAPVHQREIFREFYKVPSHAGTSDGFGLGLYIVSRLTHILGHPLTLRSRVGRGTVFLLSLLPTDPRAAAERTASAVARAAGETGHFY